MIIPFTQDNDSGKCFTPCPYGEDCMVYSFKCSCCAHFFGAVENENKIRCTGDRKK